MKKQVKNNILIFGNGQIGNFYLEYFRSHKVQVNLTKANITSIKQIENAVKKFKPNVVINTAAKTNLEWCAAHKLEAFQINVLGADNFAQVCDEKGIYFVHMSSGCIMGSKDENDAKTEDDSPQPISYYSWTKVWSEQMVTFKRSKDFKYLILRPRQPVSAQVNHKNMLVKMLTFTRFIENPNSGTVIEDLMEWTKELIDKRIAGVINVANPGWSTPYRIGRMLKKHVLPTLPTQKITKAQLNKLTPEKRVDTILDVSRLESIVGKVKPFEVRLEEIVIELGENLKREKKSLVKNELEMTAAQSKQRTIVNDEWKTLIH